MSSRHLWCNLPLFSLSGVTNLTLLPLVSSGYWVLGQKLTLGNTHLDLLVDEQLLDRFSIAFDETSVVHPDPEGQRQTEVLVLDVHPVQVRLVHVQPHFRVALAYKFNVADLSDKPHKGKLSLFQMSTNYH